MTTETGRLPDRLVGIDLNAVSPLAVVARAGEILPTTISIPPTAYQNDTAVRVGRASDTEGGQRPAGFRSDILYRFGDRALVPLWDTFVPADHLVSLLLVALRAQAQRIAGGPLDIASIAHPPEWDSRRRRLLTETAGAAGLTDVRIMTSPEAAAWAPLPTPPSAAVATGAVHRWLRQRPRTPSTPNQDITVQLAALAAACDNQGDHRTAATARNLGQAIYEHRMGIRGWSTDPATSYAAVVQQATALLRARGAPGSSSGGT
jgi:hypothetical protein